MSEAAFDAAPPPPPEVPVADPAADVVRLKALLADLQWSGQAGVTPVHRAESTCPDCGAFRTNGHTSICRIAPELP